MISPNHKKMIAVAIMCLLVGLAVGYIVGYRDAIEWIAGVAVQYEIFEGMNTEELADALMKYRQHIDSGT